jgi:hypothetical protein
MIYPLAPVTTTRFFVIGFSCQFVKRKYSGNAEYRENKRGSHPFSSPVLGEECADSTGREVGQAKVVRPAHLYRKISLQGPEDVGNAAEAIE